MHKERIYSNQLRLVPSGCRAPRRSGIFAIPKRLNFSIQRLSTFKRPIPVNSTTMTLICLYPMRLVIKRSFQRQLNLPSSAKRQRSNLPERPSDKHPPSSIKTQEKSISTAQDPSSKSIWERLGPISEVIGAYSRIQQRRPWATQFGTSLVVYLCGDLVAQKIDGEQYNPLRTLRHLTIGGICSIPAYTW